MLNIAASHKGEHLWAVQDMPTIQHKTSTTEEEEEQGGEGSKEEGEEEE